MKHSVAAALTASFALMLPSALWAQDNSGAAPPAVSEHPDELVRMHQQVAAANREYEKEVGAAKKIFDHKKAAAAKKRDAAIQIAHSHVSQ